MLGEIRALPGVQHAAYISYLPMVMRGGIWPVILDFGGLSAEARASWAPDPSETRMASFRLVTPGFFATTGFRSLRAATSAMPTRPRRRWVAVVSQSFAEQHWPGQDQSAGSSSSHSERGPWSASSGHPRPRARARERAAGLRSVSAGG